MKLKTRKLFTTKVMVALLALALVAAAAVPAAVKGTSSELGKLDGGGYLEETPPEGETPTGSGETPSGEASPDETAAEEPQEQEQKQEEDQVPQEQKQEEDQAPQEQADKAPQEQADKAPQEPSEPQPESPAAAPVQEPAEEPAEASKSAKSKRGGVSVMANYTIDLSEDTANPTNAGYSITLVSGDTKTSGMYTLTFNGNAIGHSYTIMQSDKGKCIFRNIVVDGTSITNNSSVFDITLNGINVNCPDYNTPTFALRPGSSHFANVNLTLKGENTLKNSWEGTDYRANAALHVPARAKLTIKGGDDGKLTATGGNASAGIGGNGTGSIDLGYNDVGTITIEGGNVTANGGSDGAGIGSGMDAGESGAVINIKGGTVEANGGNGCAGIGGGSNVGFGEINITGGTVKATGGPRGVGIGGGGVFGRSGTINISSGTVYATGGTSSVSSGDLAAGAGIGCMESPDKSLTVNITGGTVVAKGGSCTYTSGGTYYANGAGIGRGAANRDTNSLTANVNISSGADVTATGAAGGGYGAAGIGPGYGNFPTTGTYTFPASGEFGKATVNLSITSTAKVRAYAKNTATGSPLRGAFHVSKYSGGYYFVNAKLNAASVQTVAARLDVYANGGATVSTQSLQLPSGYNCFAYTTGSTGTQNDNIMAYKALGNVLLGTVLRTGETYPASANIPSTTSYNTVQSVEIGGGATVGTPTVSGIAATFATFRSTGHKVVSPATFVKGGFKYSDINVGTDTDPALSSTATDVPWSGSYSESDKTYNASDLKPSTRYYMATYFNATYSSTSINLTSGVVSFTTLPKINSVNATRESRTSAKVTAAFVGGNRNITSVKIYYATSAVSTSSPSVPLPSGSYSNTGFTDYALTLPSSTSAYNLLVEITNQDGGKATYTLPVPAMQTTSLTLSKVVTGAYASKKKEFTFTIQFKDQSNAALPAGTTFSYTGGTVTTGAVKPGNGTLRITGSNGKATLTLCHGQSVTIDSLVVDGTKITISETGDTTNYAVSFTDSYDGSTVQNVANTNEFAMTGATRTVAFTNTWNMINPPDSGIASDSGGLLLISLASLSALITVRRRITAALRGSAAKGGGR